MTAYLLWKRWEVRKDKKKDEKDIQHSKGRKAKLYYVL